MKLIILGAGASFDSIYEYFDRADHAPFRPPLANELLSPRKSFRNIILSYPGGRYFISQLNGNSDVEAFFENQWNIIENNRADDLMAAFINLNYCISHLMTTISYGHFEVGLSNYDVLVQKAYEYSVKNEEDVIFVTFNYDILLEFALAKVYYGQARQLTIDEYINKPLKIIKPHGSCNWFKKINGISSTEDNFLIHEKLYADRYTVNSLNKILSSKFEVIESPITFSTQLNMNVPKEFYFPQLLIPLKEKDQFILPQEHESYLRNNAHKIDEMLIIGWKGTERNFLDLLKNNLNNKKISITSVNIRDTSIEDVLNEVLPNSVFNHYQDDAFIRRADNTRTNGKTDFNSYLIDPLPGSFSSYVIGLLQNQTKSIFSTK